MKLKESDCTVKNNENESVRLKSQAIGLLLCRQLTKMTVEDILLSTILTGD